MSLLGLAYVFIRRSWVMKQDAGDGKMKEISDHIYEGALAFLNAEYRLLSVFVLVVSMVLAGISYIVPTTHYLIVVSFIFGAFLKWLSLKFAWPLAKGVLRSCMDHLHLIHKSINQFFINYYLIYQGYTARARAPLGAPGAKVRPTIVGPMFANPFLAVFW